MRPATTELFDFQIENHISQMEHNLKMLETVDNIHSALILGFMRKDLEHFKRTVHVRREAQAINELKNIENG